MKSRGIVDTQQTCGLEIPCVLHFIVDNHDEGKKAKKLFQSTLSIEVKEAPMTKNS